MKSPLAVRIGLAAFASVLLTGAAAADVLVVSPSGPFTSIQAAVDAAVDGDTVLVPGSGHAAFTIDGKGIEVLADGDAKAIFGTLIVRNVAAHQRVLVKGFSSLGLPGSHGGLSLLVQNNAGAVRFADCSFEGAAANAHVEWDCTWQGAQVVGVATGSHGASVDSSESLAFVRCDFRGGAAASTFTEAFFNACGDLCVCLPSFPGGHGLLTVGSKVSLYDCTALGGRGGEADIIGGTGGDGVHAILGTVFSSGGAYVGGDGGIGWDYIWSKGGDGGGGYRSTSTWNLHLDDFALGGEGAFGFAGPYGADGSDFDDNGPTIIFPGTARSFDVDSPVREGELATFELTGEPGDLSFLIVSLADGHLLMQDFQGALLGGLPFELVLFAGVLPASGKIAAEVATPGLPPGMEALSLRLQALLSPDGTTAVLSSWAPFVIVDASF